MKKVLYRICATLLPVLIGGIVTLFVLKCCEIPEKLDKIEFLLNALITCAATFSGFILTSVAILLGMTDNAIVRKISNSGSIAELTCMYTVALVLSLALIIFCTVAGVHMDGSNVVNRTTFVTGVFMSVAFIWSIIQSGAVLIWIMHLASSNIVLDEKSSKGAAAEPRGDYRIKASDNDTDPERGENAPS